MTLGQWQLPHCVWTPVQLLTKGALSSNDLKAHGAKPHQLLKKTRHKDAHARQLYIMSNYTSSTRPLQVHLSQYSLTRSQAARLARLAHRQHCAVQGASGIHAWTQCQWLRQIPGCNNRDRRGWRRRLQPSAVHASKVQWCPGLQYAQHTGLVAAWHAIWHVKCVEHLALQKRNKGRPRFLKDKSDGSKQCGSTTAGQLQMGWTGQISPAAGTVCMCTTKSAQTCPQTHTKSSSMASCCTAQKNSHSRPPKSAMLAGQSAPPSPPPPPYHCY